MAKKRKRKTSAKRKTSTKRKPRNVNSVSVTEASGSASPVVAKMSTTGKLTRVRRHDLGQVSHTFALAMSARASVQSQPVEMPVREAYSSAESAAKRIGNSPKAVTASEMSRSIEVAHSSASVPPLLPMTVVDGQAQTSRVVNKSVMPYSARWQD